MSLSFMVGWVVECPRCHHKQTYDLKQFLGYDDPAQPVGSICKNITCRVPLKHEWTANDRVEVTLLRQEIAHAESHGLEQMRQRLADLDFPFTTELLKLDK